MSRDRWIGTTLMFLCLMFLGILIYARIYAYHALPQDQRPNIIFHFSDVFLFILSTTVGFCISYFFFYKSKIIELKESYFKSCANYNIFVDRLKELKYAPVDRIINDSIGTIESQEMYIFDSMFIDLSQKLSSYPKSTRKQLINDLITKIGFPTQHKSNTPCKSIGCDGVICVSLRKGESSIFKCEKCGIKYYCYVTKNNKIASKPANISFQTLSKDNFEENISGFLCKSRLDFTLSDLKLLSKKLVNILNKSNDISIYDVQKLLLNDEELIQKLDDISDCERFLQAIIKSRSIFINSETGFLLKFKEKFSLNVSEQDIYLAYIKFVAHRIMSLKILKLDRTIVKKLLRRLLPEGIINDSNINSLTREVLLSIKSGDEYLNYETDAP